MSFSYKVYQVVRKIPRGSVMTYKQVAKFAGNEMAYRAVGNILHKNPDVQGIPCHRVVRSDLRLAEGYAFGGKVVQKKMLQKEGIMFKGDLIIS